MGSSNSGNPNPSPSTRFVAGVSGNPAGQTSEHRKAVIRAAEVAAKVSEELVMAVASVLETAGNDGEKLELLKSDTLRLLKEVQDRAHGTAKSSVDLTSEDGSMSPSASPDAVLEALTRKHADT